MDPLREERKVTEHLVLECRSSVRLTLLTPLQIRLGLQILLGPALNRVYMCPYMCVYKREMHVTETVNERSPEPQTQSMAEREGQGSPHALGFSNTLAVGCFYSSAWRPFPCPDPLPSGNARVNTGRNDQGWYQRSYYSPTSEVRVRSVLLEDIQLWQGLTCE